MIVFISENFSNKEAFIREIIRSLLNGDIVLREEKTCYFVGDVTKLLP